MAEGWKCFEAEYKKVEEKPIKVRHHKGRAHNSKYCESDYSRIAIIAPSFARAAELAQAYRLKHYPNYELLSVEFQNYETVLIAG